jgi:hypothetical protein
MFSLVMLFLSSLYWLSLLTLSIGSLYWLSLLALSIGSFAPYWASFIGIGSSISAVISAVMFSFFNSLYWLSLLALLRLTGPP